MDVCSLTLSVHRSRRSPTGPAQKEHTKHGPPPDEDEMSHHRRDHEATIPQTNTKWLLNK